jgi:hypothetical protein
MVTGVFHNGWKFDAEPDLIKNYIALHAGRLVTDLFRMYISKVTKK